MAAEERYFPLGFAYGHIRDAAVSTNCCIRCYGLQAVTLNAQVLSGWSRCEFVCLVESQLHSKRSRIAALCAALLQAWRDLEGR